MHRIGVIGCGAVADFGHIPAILETPGLQLVALYDPNPERVALLGAKYGIEAQFTKPAPFYDQRLDAVVIASPAPTHLVNAKLAAAHNCHILCEKPLGMTDVQSQELADAVHAAGRMLFTGFVYRFSPVAQQMRAWIREGIVGDIRALRLIYDWNLHGQYIHSQDGTWTESELWKGRMREGGPMEDCGVHQIDLTRWWLGDEIQSWTASGAWVSNYEAPDHLYLHLQMAGGALSTVETSFTFCHTARDPISLFSYQLIGTGGLLRYERDGYILEARTGSGTISLPGSSEKDFPAMHRAFSHALETGEAGDLASAEDGIIATRLAIAGTQAAIAARTNSRRV